MSGDGPARAAEAEAAATRVPILLVDDHPENLLALEVVLKDLGHELVMARSGRAALKCLLERDFALIVLDVQMLDMDGFETAGLIRARERSRLTPIIFLTGYGKNEQDISRGYSLGAVDYLFKPFAPEVLRAKVSVFAELYVKNQQVREQARRLERLNAELSRSNAELETFASVASHDLQEPLRKIVAFGDRLRRQLGELSPDGKDSLDRMQSAAQRMGRLIESLLRYSKVSVKHNAPRAVDLNLVVRDVLGDLEERLERSRGTVEVGPLPVVSADPEQMQELFQNLIANALKFAKKDQAPSVHIRGWTRDGSAGVEVEDDGVGFDQRFADRLFKPFQRLHGRSEFEGTGMGLAICQKIVQRHGGTLSAASAPGAGARFRVTFPAAAFAARAEEHELSDPASDR